METLKQVLIRRDDITSKEAENQINEAKEALIQYLQNGDITSAYDICGEYFALEPDFLIELI